MASGISGSTPVGALESDVGLVDPVGGVAEQTLVDVADLLDVDVAEGDAPGFALDVGDLHRAQDVQHDAVGDRDRESALLVGRGQEREPLRVEEGAAVGRHAEALERRAAEQRLAGGQQPVPGQGRGVEGLFALLGLARDRGGRARRAIP